MFLPSSQNLQTLIIIHAFKWSIHVFLLGLGMKAAKVSVDELACSVLSMTFFDRLFESGIVREQGHISKCFDEYFDDYTISDELRKVIYILQEILSCALSPYTLL